MNAVNIIPKTVEVIPAKTTSFSTLVWRTTDDPFARKLQVIVNNQYLLTFSGAEYDALGQWTDSDMKAIILAKYALTEDKIKAKA